MSELAPRTVRFGISFPEAEQLQARKRRLRIARNVPIPPRRNPGDKGYTATLRRLGVGESVVLPRGPKGLYTLIEAAGLKGKATARQVAGGIRVWRTKE